jgi:predicted DNA-binding transcriptional regulator AlpA
MTNDNANFAIDEDPRKDLLSDQQISELWPISKATIIRQRRAGRFPPPVKVGRKNLTWRSAVAGYFRPKAEA